MWVEPNLDCRSMRSPPGPDAINKLYDIVHNLSPSNKAGMANLVRVPESRKVGNTSTVSCSATEARTYFKKPGTVLAVKAVALDVHGGVRVSNSEISAAVASLCVK